MWKFHLFLVNVTSQYVFSYGKRLNDFRFQAWALLLNDGCKFCLWKSAGDFVGISFCGPYVCTNIRWYKNTHWEIIKIKTTTIFWSNRRNILINRNAFRYACSWHSCDIDKDRDLHGYTFIIVTIYNVSCSVNDYTKICNAIFKHVMRQNISC